ncbi:hypothetical protein T01_15203 [Trichinella spiralis]|uniref:Uncharacterized protein n=1 Tax=Trichinella spiralis TaxID=6334 RepID=A0A0V1AZK9_TRISP|nr:hypothetical protein T01_15203 [Trichinella spiralis]
MEIGDLIKISLSVNTKCQKLHQTSANSEIHLAPLVVLLVCMSKPEVSVTSGSRRKIVCNRETAPGQQIS